jgi:chaperonin GroES
MIENIKPLADRVLVEPIAKKEKTVGGIIIPDTAQDRTNTGTVVATGPGTKENLMTVKVGDTVLYGKNVGSEHTFNGKDYLFMRENDLIAII